MTGIAVVASAQDAKFAEEVRAALQASGLDAFLSQSLPKAASLNVVLIWSAALEAGHAMDAQALIGLWSEDRLVIARRDETPLPLGLRDLPSLPPSSSAAEVCAAVPGVRFAAASASEDYEQVSIGSMTDLNANSKSESIASPEVELEFWRAIKDGNDPDDFELYVQQFPTGIYAALAKRKIAKLRGTAIEDANAIELEKREVEEAAKREAEFKQKLADEKAKLEAQLVAGEAVYEKSVVEGKPKIDAAALAAKAELARREADLAQKLADAPKAKVLIGVLIGATVAIAAVGGGSFYFYNKSSFERQAALTAALESATRASEELKQAQARQLEALKALDQARVAEDAARKSGDVATLKEAQDAAKRAEAVATKQAEAVKQREAAAADARKKAQDGVAAAKAAAIVKAEPPEKTEVAAAAPVAEAPTAEAPRAETAMAKAPEPAGVKSERSIPRSQRERAIDEEAAQRALSRAASAPVPGTASENELLYQQALAMEQDGKAAEAIRLYRRAARAGAGKAALRLGEIYSRGAPGVARDYAESLQWYETARQLGEQVEPAKTRGGSEAPVVAAPAPAPEPKPVAPEPIAVAKSKPIAEPPAPVIPETAKSDPAKAAVKSAPAAREPAKRVQVAAAKPAPVQEPVKTAEPAPVPVPSATPEPPKAAAAAPSPAPAPESKPAWFSLRGLLIALLVLGLIAWRRARRREKAEARHAQRQSSATTIVPVLNEEAPARAVYKPGTVAPLSDAALFVSYSHKDRSRVEPIVSVIEEMGRRVWMDRSDITGQTGWAGQIVRAIRECRAVVLMASPNSYTSDQVVRELYLAMNHRKTIVPIEIEPAEMPDELQYILAPFQHHRLSAGETRAVLGRALAAV